MADKPHANIMSHNHLLLSKPFIFKVALYHSDSLFVVFQSSGELKSTVPSGSHQLLDAIFESGECLVPDEHHIPGYSFTHAPSCSRSLGQMSWSTTKK